MPTADLQIQVFNAIKAKLPPHLSLAEEVAATLAISTDSAYRRIRGEKPLLLEEVGKLCARFGLSLDSLLHLQSEGFLFKGEFFQPEKFPVR
jgi:plasmid maintenance system antidote protein VapI